MKIKVDKLGLLVDAQNDFITGALKNDFAKAKIPKTCCKPFTTAAALSSPHCRNFL